jgi:hypothetical protein
MLEIIMALSRQLVSLAESDQWSEAASIEGERRARIQEYFATLPSDHDVERHQQMFQALLDVNGTVMSMLSERRQHLIRDLRSAEQGRAAVRAYNGNRE